MARLFYWQRHRQRGREFMKLKSSAILAVIMVALGWRADAQIYDTNGDYVQTFAGSSFSGYVDGSGQQTMFNEPNAIVSDSQSNLFVWDAINYRIRKIAPDSTVSTFAGGGSQSTGVGTNANFFQFSSSSYPNSMTIDHNNTIWMVNSGEVINTPLYKIKSNAMVTYTTIPLTRPWGICADSHGNIYISDYSGNKIYQYTNGVLAVFAGSGNSGYADGNGIFTAFSSPTALAADAADNIYVWDWGNGLIRKIDQNQNVTTFAGRYHNFSKADGVGTNAAFYFISSMCFDSFGNLILADDSCIRKISPTTNVVTMAGSFTQSGFANGTGIVALFNNAGSMENGVCIMGGTIFVADSNNQRIRNITFNPQPQIVSGANLGIGTFAGVTITGTVGRTYQIQSSPDLNTWNSVATVLLTSSPYLWIDKNPVSGNKFYRAVMLP
jgi:sugar lactone lactonase YvrE